MNEGAQRLPGGAWAWLAIVAVLGAACSDDATGPTIIGPVADVSEELTGGSGIFLGSAEAVSVPAGYVDHEYVAAGTATAYEPEAALIDDGRWSFLPSSTAEYRTRIVVRRPARAADASGTVLIEWLNVSGGVDANPDYTTLHEEILRRGHVWVGVSAQLIGVEGGPVLVTTPLGEGIVGEGLKGIDPARYGSLSHPGDGYAFDIYTQVARALRLGEALGGIRPAAVLAVGESQSAIALTTYYNGVQPLTDAFDGFFVHSRGATTLPLVGPGEFADLAGSIGASLRPILRTDGDVPVMQIQAEGDVTGLLASSAVRQDDTEIFRLWEVAGTAHADANLVGDELQSLLDCGAEINDAPFHVVAKAALRALDDWVRAGVAPVVAPRLELTGSTPEASRRDADGIALGGIRTPPVDVPVDVLSGAPGPSPDVICLLLGSTTPLPDERIAELYVSRDDYVGRYEAAADAAIAAGFVLPEDRDALLGYAQPGRVGG